MPYNPRRPFVSVGLLDLLLILYNHILSLKQDTLDVYDSSCNIRFTPSSLHLYFNIFNKIL